MLNVSTSLRALRALSCASLATLLIASCGGGGGGSASDTAAAATDAASVSQGTNGSAGSAEPADSSPAAGPSGQDASKYELVFSDEFNNGYNTSNWNDAIWYEGSNATKNYAVEDGKLKIWPQRDASGNFFNRTIDTDGKKYFTYGFFEIEAKLPYGKGVWPAFWLLNHDGADPFRPEIDILEAYPGGGPSGGWGSADLKPVTFQGTVWPNGINGNPRVTSHKTLTNLPDLSAGYHKYAVKWEPNKVEFYFDGKLYHTANVSMPNRMYVLLDLWYGSASGTPDNSTPTGKGNAFEVNYVRVWKNK
jgi:beta-glucanase (GH16 family)